MTVDCVCLLSVSKVAVGQLVVVRASDPTAEEQVGELVTKFACNFDFNLKI